MAVETIVIKTEIVGEVKIPRAGTAVNLGEVREFIKSDFEI